MTGYGHSDVRARFYEYIAPGVPGDVAFYVQLAREAGGPIVELACGTGRVLVPVAQASPHSIYGVDASRPMLARCREAVAGLPPDVGARITLVEADMRAYESPEPAGLVLVPYRSFHHLLTVEDQERCLACIRRALAPDGRACINCFDPNLDLMHKWFGESVGELSPRVDFRDEATGHAVHVATSPQGWDREEQRVRELWTFTEFDGDRVVGEYENLLELRYAFRYELQHLFRRMGFAIEALYGDFDRGPFRHGAEQVWLLRPAA